MIKFLDLYQQYKELKEQIDAVIDNVIRDCAFIKGHYVNKFQGEFSDYIGTEFCLGVGNGTDALEIAIEALDLPKYSDIIVPANSFIATSEAVTRTGHNVIFCDCNEWDYTLSIEDLKKKITLNTRAIIPVHLFGCPCDMNEIIDIAEDRGLKIIEDCAQAHGAEYNAKKVGTFGDVATFSFFPGKLLGAYGDGGAIVTNNSEIAERCMRIANHGRIKKFDHLIEGRNSRLDGLQAGILSVKLSYLDKWIEQRIKIANVYNQELKGVVKLTELAHNKKHAYHQFVIRTSKRDELREFLKDGGIPTGIHYPDALPSLKAYERLCQQDTCTQAQFFSDRILSLPIHEYLTGSDLFYISRRIVNHPSLKDGVFLA